MRPVRLSSLDSAYWFSFNDEPIVTAGANPYSKLSDPVFLLPEETPDSLWHMFATTTTGIAHFTSTSGLEWKKEGLTVLFGRTPSIYREGNVYYLLYEATREKGKLMAFPSSIKIISSTDLIAWTEPRTILESQNIQHSTYRNGKPRLSRPQLLQWNGRYRLYFGGGVSRVTRDSFPSAAYFLVAEAFDIEGPFECMQSPLLQVEPDTEYRNMAVGSVCVIPCTDGLAAIECARFYDSKCGKERSAMILLESADGFAWINSGEINITSDEGWASTAISSCDLRYKGNEETWYCYFSAAGIDSESPVTIERQSIGLLLGKER